MKAQKGKCFRNIRAASTAAFGVFVAGISISQFAAAQSPCRTRDFPITKREITALSAPVFIENIGQFDPKVKFQVKIGSQTAWLTSGGIVFDSTRPADAEKMGTASTKPNDSKYGKDGLLPFELKRAKPEPRTFDRHVFSEDFVGANCCAKVEGKESRPGVYNYFQSSDPSKWRTDVRAYSEVVYRDVWPGIDLRIYGNGPDLEQEFIVQPGGDLRRVQIAYQDIDGLTITKDGSLDAATAFGTLRETKPRLYQQIGHKQVPVEGPLGIGASTTVPMTLNVPITVTRFL
jgi:hypothetical protein